MAQQRFVDLHLASLIQRVTSVVPIADELLAKNMLSQEMYSEIRAANTSQYKMRKLLSVIISEGHEVESYFCKLLQEYEPYLYKDLQKFSPKTSTGKPEEGGNLRWKQSSIKHRDTINEFMQDFSKRKVGNIYFSKKHIIGSGSSGIQVYLGLKKDGTEVAIKRITKNPLNNKHFENELKLLQDLKLESKNIVRYVDFVEDDDFYYLALQLCECDLERHMQDLRKPEHEDKQAALKKIVCDVLCGLRDLHHAQVIHRDIKPTNVFIDSGNNARLADFGLSQRLEEGSTVYTVRAGTRGWEAVETLDSFGDSGYKRSSDVQVAGMLVYYILSDGKHPFGVNTLDRETNIREGNYSLDDVHDIVAKDLIKRMINITPEQRPTIDEALQHPFFWDDVKKRRVLNNLGDRDEVQKYELLGNFYNLFKNMKKNSQGEDPTAKLTIYEVFDQLKIPAEKRNHILKIVGEDLSKLCKLCDTAKMYSVEKSFSNWKKDLLQIWPDINQKLPEDLLGLLRVLRNKIVHARQKFNEQNMLNHFPDFFISLYGLAKDLRWDI